MFLTRRFYIALIVVILLLGSGYVLAPFFVIEMCIRDRRYNDIAHSYILELKYLSVKDFDSKAESQWAEAVEQIKGYAIAPRVRQLTQGTQLHCIVMQFRGWELMKMEEVPYISSNA